MGAVVEEDMLLDEWLLLTREGDGSLCAMILVVFDFCSLTVKVGSLGTSRIGSLPPVFESSI